MSNEAFGFGEQRLRGQVQKGTRVFPHEDEVVNPIYMLAQEETKIRKDPAARTTSLLKDVFGQRI